MQSGSKFAKIIVPARRLLGSISSTTVGSSKICDAEKFVLLVQSCADVRSLKKLHARVLAHGLGLDVTLGSKILGLYAHLGALPDSRLVFQSIVNGDLALWNSAMVDYFRAGYSEQVILLYRRLKLHQFCLNEKTITFGLKSCTELRNLFLGEGLHADSLKLGLSGDKFVGSSLIGLYSKLGKIDDSQRVFEEIFDRDIVAYTSMISGYSDVVDSSAWNAFKIASEMIRNNLEVNRVTLVSLLQVAGNLEAFQLGKSMHCYSIRRGIGVSDEVLETSLVDMYVRCGAYRLAYALLNNSKGTVASWNAVLSGLTRTQESWNTIQYFSVMLHNHKITPDSVTLATVLSACAELCHCGYAASIHAYLIRRTIALDLVLTTALIGVYSKCKRIVRSRHLFDQLLVKDVVSYNALIYGYLQNGLADEATALLNYMIKEYVAPNSATVLSLLAAFADQRDLVRGRWIHGFAIRRGFSSDVDIANQILHMYSVCREIVAAKIVFDSLEKKNLVSWTAMMKGCLSSGRRDVVVRLCQLMQQHGKKPDSVTLIYAVQAVSELGHLNGVKQIHCFVYHAFMEKDTITANSLITAYAKCGRLDLSEAFFYSLEHKNLDSWNAVISAYGMHGFYIKVLEMFRQMEEEKIKPDELTFSSVLSACSHAGLVKEGWSIFQSMISLYSVHPQEEHYGCIVDLLGRAGHLEEAYNFIKLVSVTDKSSMYCALLSACRTYGNTLLGHTISKELLGHGPQDPDIDECKQGNPCKNGGICKNRLGGYDCPCKSGMKDDGKGGSCTVVFSLAAKAAVGAVGGILLLVILSFLIILRKEKNKMKKFYKKNGDPTLEKVDVIKLFKKGDLKPILKSSNLIGKGCFGEVYSGLLDNKLVAIKKPINGSALESGQFAAKTEALLANEVIIESQVIHKNIVDLLVAALKLTRQVYEYYKPAKMSQLSVRHAPALLFGQERTQVQVLTSWQMLEIRLKLNQCLVCEFLRRQPASLIDTELFFKMCKHVLFLTDGERFYSILLVW